MALEKLASALCATFALSLLACGQADEPSTPDDTTQDELTKRPEVRPGKCKRTGCSGQICSDQDIATTCEWREEYACYQSATCTRQEDGACGWTETPELEACLGGGDGDGGTPQPEPVNDCKPTGCSGQICSDQDIATTCEWREEYACYQSATCTRQEDGACGWTATPELEACLDGSGAGGSPSAPL